MSGTQGRLSSTVPISRSEDGPEARRWHGVQPADGLRRRHGVQSADGLRRRRGVQPLGGPSGVPRCVHHGGDEGEKLDNMKSHIANACYCIQGGNKELGKARVY